MPRWTLALRFRRITPAFPRQGFLHKRFYSSTPFEPSIERYTVPCASAGHITVSLYNVADRPPTDPLIIWIPPFAARDENDPNYHLPSWLHKFSVAVIHYRWSGLHDDRPKPKPKPEVKPNADVEPEFDDFFDEAYFSSDPFSEEMEEDQLAKENSQKEISQQETSQEENTQKEGNPEKGEQEAEEEDPISITPHHWPTPIHDVLFGYSWIIQNLQPPWPKRKDVYICGSYLGASLAAGLALTESYPHARMTVRGLLAYNGIYDWTTFLPDHPIHRPRGDDRILIEERLHLKLNRDLDKEAGPAATSPVIAYYQRRLEDLFGTPSGLFDNFASACLFFHTAGLFVPPTFDEKYVPEWLLPPPPGPLITGVDANTATATPTGQGVSDPHDPFTPPSSASSFSEQPPLDGSEPLPETTQTPTFSDDFDPEAFDLDHLDPNAVSDSHHHLNDASGDINSVAAQDMLQEHHQYHHSSSPPGTPGSKEGLKVQIHPGRFPRKAYLHFPPPKSMLKLPDTLLLYETPSSREGGELPPFKCDALARVDVEGAKENGGGGALVGSKPLVTTDEKRGRGRPRKEPSDLKEAEEDLEEVEERDKRGEGQETEKETRPKPKRKYRKPPVAITAGENSFRTQAYELALLMQRSIETLELKERRKWDEDYLVDIHYWEIESARRVKVADVGVVDDQDMEIGDLEGVGDLDERGRKIVLEWLAEKMDKAR
ncbi:hypothetical protein B0T20DRAFT_403038 [Sordaria brevicollis]|uniref:Alpha/beta hydrolase fold-3 domain-containing protein n=1 Tax=Sordaria brevicollis TaxID=83679 RepID=A0AAE0UFA4_SORBR|nr:hypothetical protein B0T20DRAFT_403038 [Sordaria brevicollis]